MAGGVGEEVDGDSDEGIGVDVGEDGVCRGGDLESGVLVEIGESDGLGEEGDDVYRFGGGRGGGFGAGEDEELLDEAGHGVGGGVDDLQGVVFVVLVGVGVEGRAGGEFDAGQGGAEFVGGIGGELFLGFEEGFLALEGFVEAGDHFVEFCG